MIKGLTNRLRGKPKPEKPETPANQTTETPKKSKNEPNDYATWSLGLWHLIQMSNNEKYQKGIHDLKIAEDRENNGVTFGVWSEQIRIIKDVRDIESADYLDYKLLDLGGGDQAKILELIEAERKEAEREEAERKEAEEVKIIAQNTTERKALFGRPKNENLALAGANLSGGGDLEKNKAIVEKFQASKGTLITAGSLDQRKERLTKFIDNKKLNEHTYALLPEMETKLTALSYYDKAMQTMQTEGYSSLCLLPVGSTDAHIIIYNSDGSVDIQTHENYIKLSEPIQLKECDHYVFAGSATYYVKTEPTESKSNVKGVYYDSGNKKSGDFIQFMGKLVLPSLKSPSNEDKSSKEDKPTYSIGGKGTAYVDVNSNAVEKCLEIGTTSGGRKNKRTKKNKKIVMKSRRNKKAMRKTKNNKRANRKNKSKRGRR